MVDYAKTARAKLPRDLEISLKVFEDASFGEMRIEFDEDSFIVSVNSCKMVFPDKAYLVDLYMTV